MKALARAELQKLAVELKDHKSFPSEVKTAWLQIMRTTEPINNTYIDTNLDFEITKCCAKGALAYVVGLDPCVHLIEASLEEMFPQWISQMNRVENIHDSPLGKKAGRAAAIRYIEETF